jgi:hypothetical protein
VKGGELDFDSMESSARGVPGLASVVPVIKQAENY